MPPSKPSIAIASAILARTIFRQSFYTSNAYVVRVCTARIITGDGEKANTL